MTATMTIGQAATAAGLSTKAVRVYERRGLVSAPARSAAGYRLFTDTDVSRLRFIASARVLGLHLDQVADVLRAAESGRPPCATTRHVLGERIGEIDAVVAELTALRARVAAARDGATPERASDTICPVIETTQPHDDGRRQREA